MMEKRNGYIFWRSWLLEKGNTILDKFRAGNKKEFDTLHKE